MKTTSTPGRQKAFLAKLADLCEEYNAGFIYTRADDGIHVAVDGEECFVGFLDEGAADAIRAKLGEEGKGR